MTDQLPSWVPLVVALLLVVMSIVPVVAKLIPPRGAPTKTASDAWPVSVKALQYRLHEEKPTVCCDQGSIAWPYPCPWHGEHDARAVEPSYYTQDQADDALMAALTDLFVAPMDRVDS